MKFAFHVAISIGWCLVSVLPDHLPHVALIKNVLSIPLFVILFFNFGGLQVNIIQFGVDQMTDASSADITRFLKWYIWVWFIGFVLMHTFKKCICNELASIPLPACLTLALCLDFNFNHWLIKEPVSKNPLKLIYRVMHYAWKNKYPRQRSAFTYCDDKCYSRMDFANRNLVDLSLQKKLRM